MRQVQEERVQALASGERVQALASGEGGHVECMRGRSEGCWSHKNPHPRTHTGQRERESERVCVRES